MADNKASNRGFAAMDKDKQRNIAHLGGEASFGKDRQRASDAGKKGAKNQPTESKRRGGQNSHKNNT